MSWDEYMDMSASGNKTVGRLDSVGTRQRCTYIWMLIEVVLVLILLPVQGPKQGQCNNIICQDSGVEVKYKSYNEKTFGSDSQE